MYMAWVAAPAVAATSCPDASLVLHPCLTADDSLRTRSLLPLLALVLTPGWHTYRYRYVMVRELSSDSAPPRPRASIHVLPAAVSGSSMFMSEHPRGSVWDAFGVRPRRSSACASCLPTTARSYRSQPATGRVRLILSRPNLAGLSQRRAAAKSCRLAGCNYVGRWRR